MTRARVRYGAAALSALLMTAAFPPLGYRFLGWVALVPWFGVLLRDRGEGHKGPGFLFGLLHFTTGLAWLFALHPLFPVGLSAILALYPLLFAFLFRRIARLGPGLAALSLPVLWVGVDFLREHLASGFPWLLPGHILAGYANLRQASDLGGEHLLTFMVILVNASFAWVLAGRSRESCGCAWAGTGIALFASSLALPLGLTVYGSFRRTSLRDGQGPRVLLIQPSFEQGLKRAALKDALTADRMREFQLGPSLQGLMEHPDTDIVVWAETMIPGELRGRARDRDIPDPQTRTELLRIADPMGVVPGASRRFLGGARVLDPDLRERNAVLLVGPRGMVEARFDKVHLTPFGEYIPGLSLLPRGPRKAVEGWIIDLAGFYPDLAAGSARPVDVALEGGRTVRLGGLVCYEVIFPALARERVLDGAEVLVNLANYGWYGTGIQEQILDVSRLRAVECRRPLVLATVNGPTCILDGNGEVRAGLPAGAKDALYAEVPLDGRGSLYASTGDVLPWACALLALVAAGAGFLAGRRPPPGGGTAPAEVRENY
jgi:apolipoprotein N-acyltransferase